MSFLNHFKKKRLKQKVVELPEKILFPRVFSSDSVVGLKGVVSSNELIAVSLSGEILWSLVLETPFSIGIVENDFCWLYSQNQIIGITQGGELGKQFFVKTESQEQIGCLAVSGDSIFVSIYRTQKHEEHGLNPRLVRLDLEGNEIWSTMLPISKIAYDSFQYIETNTRWETKVTPPWNPETWLPYGRDDDLLLSDNRVMASFSEMPRSGIGCRYIVDSESGDLVWKSKASPTSEAYSLNNGKFLMGDQGYGAFKTTLYEEAVGEMLCWKSHGYYFSTDDGRIISIELSNDSSVSQKLVELKKDGSIKKLSKKLGGYYTSKPLQLSDGHIYFWRCDKVWRWDKEKNLTCVDKIGFGEGTFADSLRFNDHKFALNIRHAYGDKLDLRSFVVYEL